MGRPKGSKNKPKTVDTQKQPVEPVKNKVEQVPTSRKKTSGKAVSVELSAKESMSCVRSAIRKLQVQMKSKDVSTWDQVGDNFWYIIPMYKGDYHRYFIKAIPNKKKYDYRIYCVMEGKDFDLNEISLTKCEDGVKLLIKGNDGEVVMHTYKYNIEDMVEL